MNPRAQIQAFGGDGLAVFVEDFRGSEQAAQSAAKICSAREVRLGRRIGAAQSEDTRRGGNAAQQLVGALRKELCSVLENEGRSHSWILDGLSR